MVRLVENPSPVSPAPVLGKRGSSSRVVESERQDNDPKRVVYRWIHATPGRLRFRVPRIARDCDYAQRLQGLLAAEPQVTSVRLKPASASVVVRYSPAALSGVQMRRDVAHLIQQASQILEDTCERASSTQPEAPPSWSGLRWPTLATTLAILSGPLGWSVPAIATSSAIAVAALPVVRRAWENLREEGRPNVDFLDLSAIAITTAQHHFLTSCSMIVLIELGEAIRDRTARFSKRQTLDLLDTLSQFVWVERDGEKQQIPIEQLQPEETVIVYPGEQIPVDGHILRGKAAIDEQKLTGESMSVVRTQGQEVYASTLVREGQLYILAERLGADTRAGRTLALLQEAPVHDTRIENYAAKIADRAVLPTLLLGGTVFAFTHSAARTASVLTIDLATGIRVSVPTTVMAATIHAARRGILIRSGRALEQLGQVDEIVFDKTGTLTQGDVAIVSLQTAEESISPLRVLELAASAEQRITHPVAEAITRYAQLQKVNILPRGDWKYRVGSGLQAQIDGQTVWVGSERYLSEQGVNLEPFHARHPQIKHMGYPTIFVASEGELQGAIQYADPLRSESREVVTTLREAMGIQIHMLTGDNRQRAMAVARQLDIPDDRVHAEAFPERKAEVVQQLHDEGKTVAFVGDGLNDSAALVYADVSVSFRDGSEVARETADVVLMTNDLRGLVEAIAIARHAQQIIQQNTGLVAIPNLSGLAIAGTVGLNPMVATLINNGTSVLAGLNGLRPVLNGRRPLKNAAIVVPTEMNL